MKALRPEEVALYCIGRRLRQFDILTNSRYGAYYGILRQKTMVEPTIELQPFRADEMRAIEEPACPSDDSYLNVGPHHCESARYALERLSSEFNFLLSVLDFSEMLSARTSHLLYEIRDYWNRRERREDERPDAAPLESRVMELVGLIYEIVSEREDRERLSDWFDLGMAIVTGTSEETEPTEFRWSDEKELATLCDRLDVRREDFLDADSTSAVTWPALPCELDFWIAVDARGDEIKQQVRVTQQGPWSRPMSPLKLRKVFDVKQDALKELLDSQTIRNVKHSNKSYRIHEGDLPSGYED
jgi:hypothetical protein